MAKRVRVKPWPSGSEGQVNRALEELGHIEEVIRVLRREAIKGKRKRLLSDWWEPLEDTASNLADIGQELEYYSMEHQGRMAWKSAIKRLVKVAALIQEYLQESQHEYKRKNYKGVGIYFEWVEQHIKTMRETLNRIPFDRTNLVQEAEKIAREALSDGG